MRTRAEFSELFDSTLPQSPLLRGIFNTLIGVFVLMQAGSGIASAQSQIILQEFGESFPYTIPSPGEAIQLKHFDLYDHATTLSMLRKAGYSEPDAEKLILSGETIAPEGELLSWHLRDFITTDQLHTFLSKKGYSSESRDALQKAAFFIPPVQDLITMAVREVFTPEIAERFGQFEDYPPDFTDFAKQQGVSEEWARNYWAAHWALPSVQLGY